MSAASPMMREILKNGHFFSLLKRLNLLLYLISPTGRYIFCITVKAFSEIKNSMPGSHFVFHSFYNTFESTLTSVKRMEINHFLQLWMYEQHGSLDVYVFNHSLHYLHWSAVIFHLMLAAIFRPLKCRHERLSGSHVIPCTSLRVCMCVCHWLRESEIS